MSRRTLGGGRVLGSGRSLGPATPGSLANESTSGITTPTAASLTRPSAIPDHVVVSPSASSLSLNGSTSGTSTPPTDPHDIASRISIDISQPGLNNGVLPTTTSGAPGERLSCPICLEEMVTLLQLNRHLDVDHAEIIEEKPEVKDWFDRQVDKAKKFQPLAILNQKLKGLDVFESNDASTRNDPAARRESIRPRIEASNRAQSPAPTPPPRPVSKEDPDDVVTKAHWQRRTGQDVCSDPTCGRRLGQTQYGIVNCRHCGKLFCEEHTMYQMKLSRSAQHEPVRGFWCRVCETCYKSREGYNDRHGLEVDKFEAFQKLRLEKSTKQQIEVSRLEKRLSRLTQLLANPPEDIPQPSRRWSSFAAWTQNEPKKLLEQSVVPWQEDTDVSRCPYCQQDFSQYTFRRHHCRTCGKVVCGDPTTKCSIILPLSVATQRPPPNDKVDLDIRLCKDCNHTLFSHADFNASLNTPEIQTFTRAYQNLLQFERGIRLLLPRFQKLLSALQDPDTPPTTQQLADASRTRKRLIDAFSQYDTAARRVRDMPSQNTTQLKLQKAIYQNASQFLHLHMLPLKALPKVLKHAAPSTNLPSSRSNLNTLASPISDDLNSMAPQKALSSIRYNHIRANSSSALSTSPSLTSAASSRISELEEEERSLRERLIVLEEQKFMVGELLADATKHRRFDEITALRGNVEDLSREIDGVSGLIAGLDFQGAYTTGGLGSGVNSPIRRDSSLQVPTSNKIAEGGGNG